MTFHRTCGKNGTRNSPTERHADEYLPNFNKSEGSGVNRRGKKQNNPTWADRYKAETGDPRPTDADMRQYRRQKTKSRYKKMRQGQAPRKTLSESLGSRMIGRSKVSGRY